MQDRIKTCVQGCAIGLLAASATLLLWPSLLHKFSSISTPSSWAAAVVWPPKAAILFSCMVIGLLIFYGMKVTVFLKRFLISLRLRIINIDRALCGIAVYATALLILTRHPFFALLPCAVAFLFFLALAFYEITPSTYVVEGNPIEDEANDILQRTPILEALEKHVAAGTPIVALVGDFGDGKTSVLKMLLKRLQNNRNVITVPFSSWL